MGKEDRKRQNTEYRIQNTEYRIQNTEYRIRTQNSEVRTANGGRRTIPSSTSTTTSTIEGGLPCTHAPNSKPRTPNPELQTGWRPQDSERSGQASVLDLDLLVQDFTAGGIHALQTSFSSSGNPEFDSRIQKLVADWGVRDSHGLIAEMIVTALRMGSDAVPVADLKLINRSLKELRLASKAFAPYQGSRKIAIFGSARTNSNTE